MLLERWWRGFFVVLLAGVLGACGGGGSSGGDDPAVPEVSLTIDAVKTFRFEWTDVANATSYKLLENPDGMSGFTPVGEAIEPGSETLELTVPLYARVNAQYILQACNSAGCADSDTLAVSGNLVSGIGYFKASDTEAHHTFGSAVSLSADGDTLAVGADGMEAYTTGGDGDQSDNETEFAGAVYVFVREAEGWLQQAYVEASNAGGNDAFGQSVSLSADGHTLAVGARFEDSAATGVNNGEGDNSADDAGAAYVFTREAGTWSQEAYLKASNTDVGDEFGWAVGLSADGQTLAVGAINEDGAETGVNGDGINNSSGNAGAVYVFSRTADGFSQQAYIKASNADIGDFNYFGGAVSLSADGNTLAVGAHKEYSNATGVNQDQDNEEAPLSGAVYVFVRQAGIWSQQAYLKASNTSSRDFFGEAVSLSADGYTLAVGANAEGSAATGVNGDEGDNSASSSGAVYVFARDAFDTWSQQAYLKASNTGATDYFGSAVSLSADGDSLAVGAVGEDSDAAGVNGDQNNELAPIAGAVYVFAREAGIWSQQTYLKASNAGSGDQFGGMVSLSADGQTLAVSGARERSGATGVGGEQDDDSVIAAGAVYLY